MAEIVSCSWCGKEKSVKPFQYKRSKRFFCSIDHKNKWVKENPLRGKNNSQYSSIEVECGNCKKLVTKKPCALKRSKKLFCNVKCFAEWRSKNLFGKNSATYKGGKIKTKCCSPECENDIYVFPYKLNIYENIFCDIKCRNVWQKYMMMEDGSPAWKGGASFEKYPREFSKELKEIVRERDDFTCQQCGRLEIEDGENLSVHHIDYVKTNSSFYNLISLCRKCHSHTGFNRKYWTKHFNNKITEKYKKQGEVKWEKIDIFKKFM